MLLRHLCNILMTSTQIGQGTILMATEIGLVYG